MSESSFLNIFYNTLKQIGASPEAILISSVALSPGSEITVYALGNGNGMPILNIEEARRLKQEGQGVFEVKIRKVE